MESHFSLADTISHPETLHRLRQKLEIYVGLVLQRGSAFRISECQLGSRRLRVQPHMLNSGICYSQGKAPDSSLQTVCR